VKIVVTFALEAEFAAWRRLRSFRRVFVEGNAVYEAQIGEAEVRVVLTGVGARNARRMMSVLLNPPPAVCISAGLAGGLKLGYRRGEILAAGGVRSDSANRIFRSDANLLRLAVGCGARAVEMFYTSERVVLRAQEKSRLGTLADAVEMESFAVLSETSAGGVPGVAIRAIGDPVDLDLPYDFNQVVGKHGRVSIPRVLAQIAKSPHRFPALVQFGRDSLRACASLARFLDRYVEVVASQKSNQEVLSQAVAG